MFGSLNYLLKNNKYTKCLKLKALKSILLTNYKHANTHACTHVHMRAYTHMRVCKCTIWCVCNNHCYYFTIYWQI